ncbi:hypothetical protein PVK06_045670 [Gossypium arboreum]|uniref:DET1- and DDB1-associated protein 1 domain-containing protein n=1 Tax=Gossypium arboreum TaxID=29729 RepID=A0ABR0MUQ0_GOSAR|nr:hypothetical protein PVK06_045670 [Gossypium arboreum]
MGSLLGVLPSFDPLNFNQLRPSDPSNPCKLMPVTYHSSHIRTPPPPDQVHAIYHNNYLARIPFLDVECCLVFETMIAGKHDEKKLRPKRAATEHLIPDH